MAEIDWKREFDNLGEREVRSALNARRWEREKQSAAREWLERADAMRWQAKRKGDASPSTFEAFRRFRWVYVVAGGALGLLGLAQVLGRLF